VVKGATHDHVVGPLLGVRPQDKERPAHQKKKKKKKKKKVGGT
jgi:hypothetical protein